MLFPKIKFSRTFIVSITIISGIGISLAATFNFSETIGVPHQYGQFYTDGSGNAGIVSFNSGGDAHLNGDKLEGSFDIETLGRAYFDSNAMIIPPTSGLVTDFWTATGTISSSGGIIYLQSGSIYNVQYNPVTRKLIGDGWNVGVGKVPFGVTTGTVTVLGLTTTGSVGISGTGSAGFVGRVKVLGNVGGNKSYDTLNPLGSKFNATIMNDNLNKIRKNIALLTRNIPSVYMNASFTTTSHTPLGNKLFYINTGSTIKTLTYNTTMQTDFPTNSVDSLIIIGGDLIIDADMINTDNTSKGIIVLKNEKGVGGNVIITKGVKNIKASIFAEGTIYSGDNISALYNDTTAEVALLSTNVSNQLYIVGSIMSRNTIGGAVQSGTAVCPYQEVSCTYEKAIQYDLNYFRNYSSGSTSERAYPNNTLDDFSVIIEIDPRFISTPPPGFEMK